MAQKALKTLAARNTSTLNRLHLTSLGVHLFYLLSSLLLTRSRLAWFLLSLPSLGLEFWFERIGRPTYTSSSGGDAAGAPTLQRAGEDLSAKGLTEWMWDVIYWTWITVGLAAVVGNWAWYAWVAVPVYTAWAAYGTFSGARQGLAGFAGGDAVGDGTAMGAGGQSKRQAKMEKRGGQKMQYR